MRVGETVPEQLQLDLELEIDAIERYNRGVALARRQGDNGTAEMLEDLLTGEEEHADWLEASSSSSTRSAWRTTSPPGSTTEPPGADPQASMTTTGGSGTPMPAHTAR